MALVHLYNVQYLGEKKECSFAISLQCICHGNNVSKIIVKNILHQQSHVK